MVIMQDHIDSFRSLFHLIKLRRIDPNSEGRKKIEQILSYLEVIDAHVRKASKKRKLVFVDSAAGNCYLSFLAYHYYRNLRDRDIAIHCVDVDRRLMQNAQDVARALGFEEMYFHASDILEFSVESRVDVAYSLHACDTATDKALYIGLKLGADSILSVSCCQHSVRRSFRNTAVKGVTRYKAFKERLLYMVADTMRAHLIALSGYRVDVFEFISSKHTDKNIMIRARKTGSTGRGDLASEYAALRRGFNLEPTLARLIAGGCRRCDATGDSKST